jgi:hypothetical protein
LQLQEINEIDVALYFRPRSVGEKKENASEYIDVFTSANPASDKRKYIKSILRYASNNLTSWSNYYPSCITALNCHLKINGHWKGSEIWNSQDLRSQREGITSQSGIRPYNASEYCKPCGVNGGFRQSPTHENLSLSSNLKLDPAFSHSYTYQSYGLC